MTSSSGNGDKKNLSISLEKAFNSTFHDDPKFEEFLSTDIKSEYKKIHLENRSNAVNPSKTLRKYHKFLNNFIFNYASVNKEVVFSYIEGKNAYDAIKKHSNSSYFFQTDIKKFFDSISTSDVGEIIDCQVGESPITDINLYKGNILSFVIMNNKLPTGFSTSPNISNSFLYNFDNIFQKYCLRNDLIYTRYVDDIIVSSSIDGSLNDIKNIISSMLEELFHGKININPNKTKHTRKGRKIKLLGMMILPSGKITVDSALREEIEISLHFYVNDKKKFEDYLGEKYKNNILTISGKLNYINTVDKNYINKLRRKYGNYIIDSFCHQTISKL